MLDVILRTSCESSITKREMKERIKHTLNDMYYSEEYEVDRKLSDIFTCGDEQCMHYRCDIMCEEIGH